MRTLALVLAGALLVCCHRSDRGPRPENNCAGGSDWLQWGRGSAHAGTSCAAAQTVAHASVDIVYDPFVADEMREADGTLIVHYQSPLLAGDDVFLEAKSGDYVPCSAPGTWRQGETCGPTVWDRQIWSERKYTWKNGALDLAWRVQSDWKPPPNAGHLGGWEPVFHAALGPADLWVPMSSGGALQVARDSGAAKHAVAPFGADPTLTYVAGPISTDSAGNAVWTVIRFANAANPWGAPDAHGFVVKAAPDGTFLTASFDSLIPGAPAAADACEVAYPRPDPQHPPVLPLLDPNGNIAPPPTTVCGTQRPSLNVAPAIGADGAIYLVSRAHRADRYSYLVALEPDLRLRWAASLRALLQDGCGVTVPKDGLGGNCRASAPDGIDPDTGGPPPGRASDNSTASPVVLPDGAVLYGAFTTYNGFRGHLLKFAADGKFTASFDFGWDTTPSFFQHGGTYSIVLKDNHYVGEGPFFITQLDANLDIDWQYRSTNTKSCTRLPDGTQSCVDDGSHPRGFEWCVNALAVDANGVVYANSEDGYLYAIYQGGEEKQRLFLAEALGAAYTPLAIDAKGRIYTQNAGHLFVVGSGADLAAGTGP